MELKSGLLVKHVSLGLGKVVAVDKSGNRSTPSGAASVTSTLIDDSHISNLTASKITAGTITAAVVIGGSATFSGTLSGATGVFSGSLSGATITGGVITGATIQTATSGQRVVLNTAGSIDFTGSTGATATLAVDSAGNLAITSSGAFTASNITGTSYINGYNGIFTGSLAVTYDISCQTITGITGPGHPTSTIGLNGAVTCNNNLTVYGTTTTINPSGNCNITTSGTYITAASGPVNLSGSSQVNLASGTSSVNVSGGTIVASSIVFQPTSLVSSSTTSSYSANVYTSSSTNGQLYRVTSSSRYKRDILPAVVDPREVLAIEAVTFVDRTAWEANGESAAGIHRGLGVIAEQVADAAPRLADWLVPRDEAGQPDSFAYDRMVIALLEVVKQQDARLAALEHH